MTSEQWNSRSSPDHRRAIQWLAPDAGVRRFRAVTVDPGTNTRRGDPEIPTERKTSDGQYKSIWLWLSEPIVLVTVPADHDAQDMWLQAANVFLDGVPIGRFISS